MTEEIQELMQITQCPVGVVILLIIMTMMTDDIEHANGDKDNGMTNNKMSSCMVIMMMIMMFMASQISYLFNEIIRPF